MRSGGIAAILALLLVSSAWGYGYLGVGLGSGVFQGSARGGGMGEVTMLSEDGPLAVTLNPALLGLMKDGRVEATYRGASVREDWAFPVHDSFDALLGYNTYSANSNIYHAFSGQAASGPLARLGGVCFALASLPVYDFRYDYEEEVRDRNPNAQPPDRVIANNFIRGDGAIASLSFGLGKAFHPSFSLGAGLDYLFGKHDLEKGISFVDATRIPWAGGNPDTSGTFSASDLSGTRFTLGATWVLGERVEVGAAYKSRAELEGDFSGENSSLLGFGGASGADGAGITVKYPASYALGVSIRPRNVLAAVVEGDVVLTKWSDVSDAAGIAGTYLDDTYEWHLGVEHIFYNGQALRFGLLYRPSPKEKETSEAAVTAGTGFTIAGIGVDLAAKVGWREYRQPDIFSDEIFGAKLRGSTDLVKESITGAIISVSRRF